jgi:hypothetical protein
MVSYQALIRIFGGIRKKQVIDFKRSGRPLRAILHQSACLRAVLKAPKLRL